MTLTQLLINFIIIYTLIVVAVLIVTKWISNIINRLEKAESENKGFNSLLDIIYKRQDKIFFQLTNPPKYKKGQKIFKYKVAVVSFDSGVKDQKYKYNYQLVDKNGFKSFMSENDISELLTKSKEKKN